MAKTKKKTKDIIRKIIFVVALCVFAYSGYQLVHIYLEYKQGTDTYDDIEDMFMENNTETSAQGEDNDNSSESESKGASNKVFVWDFKKMYDYNNDTLGYIRNGDAISYPILQTTDNDYYLHHLVNGEANSSGAIFVDALIKDGLEADNCIIYGHNMKNGSMFGTLKWYKDSNYCKKYPNIYIYTDKYMYTYKIFSMYTTGADSDIYSFDYGQSDKFVDYLESVREKSLYNIYPEYNFKKEDKIITLSTCTSDGKDRFIVQAVRTETKKL